MAEERLTKKQEIIQAAKAKAKRARESAELTRMTRKAPALVQMPDPSGDIEVDSLADLDAVQRGFRERAKNEDKRFELVVDSEYWFAVCFQSRAQKERFLMAMKWIELGDKYLDGQEVARLMGVDLPAEQVPFQSTGKIDKDWLSFVKD